MIKADLKAALFSHPNATRVGGGTAVMPPPPAWSVPATPIDLSAKAPRRNWKVLRSLWIGGSTALLSVFSYWIIARFIVIAVIVQGTSMQPTLRDGDRLLLNRWTYHYRAPQRGV